MNKDFDDNLWSMMEFNVNVWILMLIEEIDDLDLIRS